MMAKHLILVSIFMDDENKLKKKTSVKNVREIQDQARTMYPVGGAYLERFMVFCKDFEEFVDVDNSHRVEAKEKYQLHFKSLNKKSSAPELEGAPGSSSAPPKPVESMTKQEIMEAAQIYKKNLTKYRRGINKFARNIAVEHPQLLKNRDKLIKLADEALALSGYKYAGRSKTKANIKVEMIPRDNTLSEHSYCLQTYYLTEASEAQPVNEQEGSETPQENPSDLTNDQSVDSSKTEEAVVNTLVADERRKLSATLISPPIQGSVTQQCYPQADPIMESADMAALRKATMVFGREKSFQMTSYQLAMNEMAFKAALEDPSLLGKRGKLFREAQKRLYYSGYRYTRSNQTRSKLFLPGGGIEKDNKTMSKKERANRIADIEVKVTILKEQVALITAERSKVEWQDRAEQFNKQIEELQEKIVVLEGEKRGHIKKGETMKRRWAWELKYREKWKRPSSRRSIAAEQGDSET